VRACPERIVIAAEGQILCEHQRFIDRGHHMPGRTVYDWRHYLAVIQRKPGTLRNGATIRRTGRTEAQIIEMINEQDKFPVPPILL
jgi:hypothetical protein